MSVKESVNLSKVNPNDSDSVAKLATYFGDQISHGSLTAYLNDTDNAVYEIQLGMKARAENPSLTSN